MFGLQKKKNGLNVFGYYKMPLWQNPQFIFVLMGFIIFGAILASYFVGLRRLSDPLLVILLVIIITAILFLLSFIITNSFEQMAQASRMKSEMINVVSHQLRTPLTNIKFSLDFLKNNNVHPVLEKQAEYFSILGENTKRMGSLIDNLLLVSRIESKTLPMKKETFDIKKMVERSLSKCKPFLEASNIKIQSDFKGESFSVKADPLWLEQVVDNFVDNAIKYSFGNKEMNVRLKQKGKKVIFEVQDSGIGIPKEEQKYVFEKFFRSKDALKKQTHGSGLGLHIAKNIIEMSGGKIGFKSKQGQGTTFWFTLPLVNNI